MNSPDEPPGREREPVFEPDCDRQGVRDNTPIPLVRFMSVRHACDEWAKRKGFWISREDAIGFMRNPEKNREVYRKRLGI